MSYRPQKIASQLARELGQILAHEVSDPRLQQLIITRVTVSGDLKHARVLYGAPGSLSDGQRLQATVSNAAGFLRHRVGQVMRIKLVPVLDFRPDRGYWEGMDTVELLAQLEPDSDAGED